MNMNVTDVDFKVCQITVKPTDSEGVYAVSVKLSSDRDVFRIALPHDSCVTRRLSHTAFKVYLMGDDEIGIPCDIKQVKCDFCPASDEVKTDLVFTAEVDSATCEQIQSLVGKVMMINIYTEESNKPDESEVEDMQLKLV